MQNSAIKPHRHLITRSQRIKRQAGWLMIEMGMAIILSALAAGLAFKSIKRADQATMAMSQGDNLANIAKAAETLIMEHYDAYQAGLPVTRNGVTLPCNAASCTAAGEARTPTLDNLRAMGLGITPGSNFGSYKTLGDATYITQIQRIPAGCEASPNGQTCNITGLVCMDRPVQEFGGAANSTDDFGIGKIIGKIGGDGGTSIIGSQANITGAGGAWTMPNPFAGSPVGIVCARFGFGASGMGNFLRVHDARDPDFQNNVTIGGNVIVTTGTVGTGTGNPGPGECRLGEILASGAFWSRSATCIKRAWVDGANGEIGVADTAGTARATLKDTGELILSDAAGNVKAGFIANGADINARADNLNTNAGTAGLRSNGEAFGNTLVINTTAAVGGACPTNDALVWGNGLNSLKLLKCVANLWVATGTAVGTIGDACPTNGQLGETPAGVSVICVNNTWMTTTNRMGKWTVKASYLVGHNNNVPKPACDSGGIPKIKQTPKAINATYGYVNFDATDNGPGWTIRMIDGENNPAYSTSIAEVGCWYD